MKIWTDITSFKAKNACLTIGSFDGLHLGHLEVLNQLKSIAKKSNGESVVFTLDPHPALVLNPDRKITLLCTVHEKIKLLERAGIDHLILYPFSKEFADLSYQDFVKQILVEKLHIQSLLIGYDNTIGKNKEGNYQALEKLAAQYKFDIQKQTELKLNGQAISSTQIRKLLNEGRLSEASKLLGYHYIVSGKVIHGKKLGNKLGFPTANLLPNPQKFTPAIGVYIVKILYKERNYNGIMNIGIRPTVNNEDNNAVMEVNIFDFNENLYDEFIEISILKKIRDEKKFDNIEALKYQIKKDRTKALEFFQNEN